MTTIEFFITNFVNWVSMTSLMASVLVAFILLVKFILKDNLKVKWHYVIWFVLILRLMLPMAPESSFSMFNLFSFINQQGAAVDVSDHPITSNLTAAGEISQTTVAEQPEMNSNITDSNANDRKLPIQTWFLLIWLIGVVALISYLFVTNRKMARRIAKCSYVTDDHILGVFEQCKTDLRVKRNIPLLTSMAVEGPTLYGFIRPIILLPAKGLKNFSERELKYIFLHELVHYKRKDIFVNWLMTLLLVVHWFNPILWYAAKKMREDQELSCDATVVSHIHPDEVKDYGYTIIKLLEHYSQSSWTPAIANFSSNKTYIKKRIEMIKLFKKYSYKWSILGLIIVILLVGCSLTNSKSPAENMPTSSATSSTPPSPGQNTDQYTESSPAPASTAVSTPTPTPTNSSPEPSSSSVEYKNTEYGFTFSLPASWKGFSIVTSKWDGLAAAGDSGEKVIETGSLITIRDPQWTQQAPRQDIPIMVFTTSQWNALQKGAFHIGAAPIGPSELGRNDKYVFALPARYNFAFPPGYEEVEKIIESKPLQATSK